MPKFSEAKLEALRTLNANGWNDIRIGEAFDVTSHTIARWRHRAGIAAFLPFNRMDIPRAFELHGEGVGDCEIARLLNVDQSSVTKWRHKIGLPRHPDQHHLSADQKRIARKLLRQGASSTIVMKEIGCSKNTVMKLRKKVSKDLLRAGGVNDATVRRRAINDPGLLPRITKAIGEKVPEHIRDDAVYDMYTDILEGSLAADQIEKRAPSYRSRAYDMCGSKYGAVSIDAEDENGFSLADRLADPSWISEPETGWESS